MGALTAKIQGLELVDKTHHIHVWSLDGERHVLTAHLVTARPLNAEEYQSVKYDVAKIVEEYGFFHSTLELEWPEETCRIGDNSCH